MDLNTGISKNFRPQIDFFTNEYQGADIVLVSVTFLSAPDGKIYDKITSKSRGKLSKV